MRNHAILLAATRPDDALRIARKISEPWFKAQALAHIIMYVDKDQVLKLAKETAKAAAEGDDDYKRSAVRAWEIGALVHRGFINQAIHSLHSAVSVAKKVTPPSSRSEALDTLLGAAFQISERHAREVYDTLKATCPVEEHWRCKRAVRDGLKYFTGALKPRVYP